MKKWMGLGILVSMVANSAVAQSQTLSFSQVWKEINESSAAQESSRLQAESLEESQKRAARHWLPKVYLDARTYRTNDPGAVFFGLMEQRSLGQSDFNPDSINHPDSQSFTRGALGLDLALYEGGVKASQVDLFKHSVAAQKSATSQVQVEQYAVVALSYGSIAILEEQKRRLQSLSSEMARLMKGYQLGHRGNPVGYSGLLGMKSLSNRISGLMNQYEAQSRAYYATLNEMGLKNSKWVPQSFDADGFVKKYFDGAFEDGKAPFSFKIDSTKETARVSEEMSQMEKARFLPRVGAFAESYTFNGSRDSANGYNVGLYLQWSLFDPSDYGRYKEAKLKSMAAAKLSEASEQQELAEKAALMEQFKSLKQNLDLLTDSYGLLMEQSKVTETLFKNGSINALQFVEVLSRRTDLIMQQAEAEMNLIKVGSQLVTRQKFDIEKNLKSGAQNEKQ